MDFTNLKNIKSSLKENLNTDEILKCGAGFNEKPTMCQKAVATVSSSIPISELRKLDYQRD